LRGAGPRTNTPERQSGASGENADKPSPTARGGRLQHPLEMPPRAGHGGIAIEVVLSHTSPGATCGRRDSPYASTVPTHGDEAAAGAQPDSVEGWFDRCVIGQAERTHAGKARVRILSAVKAEVMRCHSGLRSPVRHGTMRGQAFVMMSVRTAVDVAVSRRVQGRLPAWP
jgi:hypothetical protein